MASDFFLTNHTLFVVSTGRKRLGRGRACSLTAPGVRGTREESSTAAPSSTYRAAVHENDSGPGYGEMLMSSLGRQREGCGVLKSKHWEDKTQGVFFTMHKGEKNRSYDKYFDNLQSLLKDSEKVHVSREREHIWFCKAISFQPHNSRVRSAQDWNQDCAEVEPVFLGGHLFLWGERFLWLLVALGSKSQYFMLRLSRTVFSHLLSSGSNTSAVWVTLW